MPPSVHYARNDRRIPDVDAPMSTSANPPVHVSCSWPVSRAKRPSCWYACGLGGFRAEIRNVRIVFGMCAVFVASVALERYNCRLTSKMCVNLCVLRRLDLPKISIAGKKKSIIF